MSYTLVVVESPAKAKTIEKYLPDGCKVAATMGHIIDLPKSKLGVDVENNFTPVYQPIMGKAKILKDLASASKKAESVILATDPDREGEAISWHLANYLGLDLTDSNRIEFNEITPNAIRAAMNSKRPINMDIVNAQQARRVLDRLVGYQISPILWKKVMRGLSAGRVQSAAAKIVVDREAQIRAFVPQEYWTASARLRRTVDGTVFEAGVAKKDGEKFQASNAEEAALAEAMLRAGTYSVQTVRQSKRRRTAPSPFITSTLQQDANRKLSFSSKKTMALAQQLYEGLDVEGEGHMGLITYMRTDSVRIAQEAKDSAKAVITARFGAEFAAPESAPAKKSKAKSPVQDAHEAIRPTDPALFPEALAKSLTRDQLRLYTLIHSRFLASQMAQAVYDTISCDISCKTPEGGELTLRAAGSRLDFPGFLSAYDEQEEEELSIPLLKKGEALELVEPVTERKFTQPPPRYTEAGLVKAMEEEGIGRPSTYAPTISTILARNYVVLQDRKFEPTELGEVVVNLMSANFKTVVDLSFTANMEKRLDKIADGQEGWVKVISAFYKEFKNDLDNAGAIERVKINAVETDIVCDKCGRNMVIKYGRFGRFLACPGFPECTNAMALRAKVDAHCPRCGKDILEKKSKKGKVFYGCAGYPECSFASWAKPTDNLCPKCGAILYVGKGKSLYCADKTCGYTQEAESYDEGAS